MTRGRPFEPGNKLGRGRPKGAPNRKAQQAHKLFQDHSAAILALAINKSREDSQMLRMLASRIVPQPRELPVKIGRLPMTTLQDLDHASKTILTKVTSGKIAISEAQEMFDMVEHRRRVLMAQELERRITALENFQADESQNQQ